MDSSRLPLPDASKEAARARRRTTTIRLLEYLTSFSENTEPSLRGTEDDPHMGFVAAIQASFVEQTTQLEIESKGRKGLSVAALISGMSADTSSPHLTTGDLARLITRGSSGDSREAQLATIAKRRELLEQSRALSSRGIILSVEGRTHFLEDRKEEADRCLKQADELFREAVLILRTGEE